MSEYFFVAFNEGLFEGLSIEFMEGLGQFLVFVSMVLLFPIFALIDEKKTKPLLKCLAVFIPSIVAALFIMASIPEKGPVRIASSLDNNKYILVEDLSVAKEVARVANDDSVRNKETIESAVEDLFHLEEK